MQTEAKVYEKTYRSYLSQIGDIDLKALGQKLGLAAAGNEVVIPLYGKPHTLSEKGITDPAGKQPPLAVCVILCKYLLLCPEIQPFGKEWAAFRDLKDSGPLTKYFANDVERAIAEYFSGKPDQFKRAGQILGGYPPEMEVAYDLALQFDALPKVPVVMLYNDADDEFPVKCSVLFESRAENYLDPESLAMLGRLLFTYLEKAADSNKR